jgi:hypothetical protein
MKIRSFLLAFVAFNASAFVHAHHTFATEYERTQMVTLEAVVTGVHFQNPHVRLDLLATVEQSEPQVWVANSVSPGALVRRAWLRDTVDVGDRITLYGNLGSNGSRRLWIQTLTLESGADIYPVGRVPEPGDD